MLDDFESIDLPSYIKSEYTGWLEPNGDFHECEYTWHLDTVHELYGTYDEEAVKNRGIIKIYWDPIKNHSDYDTNTILTDTQIKWLENNEFTIRKEDVGKI